MNRDNFRKSLRSQKALSTIARWVDNLFHFHGTSSNQKPEKTHHWFSVLCLAGVDYFSTLAYQPGVALLAVGALAPFASFLLVFVTLFGAVPTYIAVSRRSYTGQGSIAMLENILSGWKGKIIVLILIAFIVTDFVITITLSASDAAAHIIENPYLASYVGVSHANLGISIFLVMMLGVVFYLGLKEAIAIAVMMTIPFLLLTFLVIGKCLLVILNNPSLFQNWLNNPIFKMDHYSLFLVTIVAFPKLALGLSGFETSVSMMPLIKNGKADESSAFPRARVLGTKKLLIVSASIMSLCLLASSMATSILLTQAQVADGGPAAGRALSFLAHQYLGEQIGSVYDFFTIIILWFAGASAMAGLLAIIPRYLPRFGMAPRWMELRKPLVILLTAICITILLIFRADVNAQTGAYATGVLVLILSATVAVTLSFWREYKQKRRASLRYKAFYFLITSIIFTYTLLDNIYERPDGLIIGSIFFLLIILASAISRSQRAYELRVTTHRFVDEESERMFNLLKNKKADLVPVSFDDNRWFLKKQDKIIKYYKHHGILTFLTIRLRDDRSEFVAPLEIKISKTKENRNNYLIEVSGAVAIPNTIAYISEQMDPLAIYLGLARKNAMEQALAYVLFGEGEIGILTYKVLVQYWESTVEDDVRPAIFLMSD